MVANTHGTLHEDAIRYIEPRRAEEEGEGEGEGGRGEEGEEGVVAPLLSPPEAGASLPLVGGDVESESSEEAVEAQLAKQDTGQGRWRERF